MGTAREGDSETTGPSVVGDGKEGGKEMEGVTEGEEEGEGEAGATEGVTVGKTGELVGETRDGEGLGLGSGDSLVALDSSILLSVTNALANCTSPVTVLAIQCA